MKKEISVYDFINEFKNSSYANNFSTEGLHALYEYLTELEEDTGEEIELDIVAIACDFTEYDDIEEFLNDYQPNEIYSREEYFKEYPDDTEEDYQEYLKEELENYLNDNTVLIKLGDDLDDGFIIQNF